MSQEFIDAILHVEQELRLRKELGPLYLDGPRTYHLSAVVEDLEDLNKVPASFKRYSIRFEKPW